MQPLPLTYGVYDAKARLSELLERVAKGETVTITRHGRPVARIVPPEVVGAEAGVVRGQLAALRARAKELEFSVTPEQIRRSIEEGRR